MTLFGIPYQRRQLFYMLGDITLAFVAIYLAHWFRFGDGPEGGSLEVILRRSTGPTVVFVCSNVLVMYVLDAYSSAHDFRRPLAVLRIWVSVFVALLVQMVLLYALPQWWWGRGVAGLASLSLVGLLSVWRPLVCLLRPVVARRYRTLVLGAGKTVTRWTAESVYSGVQRCQGPGPPRFALCASSSLEERATSARISSSNCYLLGKTSLLSTTSAVGTWKLSSEPKSSLGGAVSCLKAMSPIPS
jgi:hypothetical protein